MPTDATFHDGDDQWSLTRSVLVVVVLAVVVIAALLTFVSQQINYDLGTRYEAHAKPWRLVQPITSDARHVQIAADGWACGEINPKAKSEVTYAADSITIALTIQDAASNCIQRQAVFVHLSVELTQAVGNRRLVDPKAAALVTTAASATP
jgi:hypothetical protein